MSYFLLTPSEQQQKQTI